MASVKEYKSMSMQIWQRQPLPDSDGKGTISVLVCPRVGVCDAIDVRGDFYAIVRTTDGGRTWQQQTSEGPSAGSSDPGNDAYGEAGALNGLSCPTADTCYAVGGISGGRIARNIILATTDRGQEWTDQGGDDVTPYLEAVACPAATTCYAVGNGAILTTTDGTTWQ